MVNLWNAEWYDSTVTTIYSVMQSFMLSYQIELKIYIGLNSSQRTRNTQYVGRMPVLVGNALQLLLQKNCGSITMRYVMGVVCI